MNTEPAKQRELGVAFIENYFELASYSHRVTAKALYLRFRRSRNPKLRKILIAQLFEEYASIFESLAVLCHSVRNRFNSDFLTSFVSHKPGIVETFYRKLMKQGSGFDARPCLQLPPIAVVERKVADSKVVEAYRESLPLLTEQLRQTAELLAVRDFITEGIFKKLKHSSVFFDDATIADRYMGNPFGTCGDGRA